MSSSRVSTFAIALKGTSQKPQDSMNVIQWVSTTEHFDFDLNKIILYCNVCNVIVENLHCNFEIFFCNAMVGSVVKSEYYFLWIPVFAILKNSLRVKMWNFYNSCGFWNFAKFFTIYVMMTNYNCLIYCKSLFSGKHDVVLKLQSKFSFYIANMLYLYYINIANIPYTYLKQFLESS